MTEVATAPVDERLRPILAYVRKLTLSPARMVAADAEAVFAAGWEDAALHDAIAVTAFFAFMNRLALGHGLAADATLFAARGGRHFKEGYIAQHAELYDEADR